MASCNKKYFYAAYSGVDVNIVFSQDPWDGVMSFNCNAWTIYFPSISLIVLL